MHGRDAELDTLERALDAVARGARRLVLARGEAGIGKTRLLSELRSRAASMRFVVLEGRATELERDVPYGPILDALGAPELVAGDAAPERWRAQRELGATDGARPRHAAHELAAPERWRAQRELGARIAGVAAGRPLLLVVDDVHWADPATRELLEHLVRRPPAESLLLALGLRPGPAAEGLLAAQRAGGAFGLDVLDLRPLDRVAAEPLLAAIPEAADRDRRFAESGGNPLLLIELARDGGAHALPGGIVAAVRAELAALAPDAQALARGASVAGDPFELDLAAAVAGLDIRAALAALDELERHTLVRATAGPRAFAFRHPVIRSAIYGGLGAGARLAGHAAAARALSAASPPVRARHLAHAAAPGDAEAAATLRAAATVVRPQAPGVAADWLLAARRADPATTDHIALAGTLIEAGRLADAVDALDAAAHSGVAVGEVAAGGVAGGGASASGGVTCGGVAGGGASASGGVTSGGDASSRAVLAAGVERLLGRHDAARRRLLAALDAAPSGDAPRVLADLALSAYQRGDYAEIPRWSGKAGGDAAVRAASEVLLAVGEVFAGRPEAGAAAADRALAALDQATDAQLAAVAELAMAIPWGLLALDRLPEGLAAATRIAAAARAGIAAIVHDFAAVLALGMLGRMREAETVADEAEQAARVSGNPQLVQWALWLLAWVQLERGRLDPALSSARESVELANTLDDSASAVVAKAVLGAVLGARGEHERASELLAAYDLDHGWICRWSPFLVESDLARGDLAAAQEHADRAAALAPGTGMAAARAAAARAQALVALAAGDAPEAARLARHAIDQAGAAGAQLEAARARLLAGRALTGDEAIANLTAAAKEAEQCGAERVAAEANQALRRAGVRIGKGGRRATETHGVDALSEREREIAALVSEGLTNREIGARLFLSEKTIETHMTHVLQKLGVRSRAQVAAEVARLSP